MTAAIRRLALVVGVSVGLSVLTNVPPAAAIWPVAIATGSSGESASQPAPIAPATVTANCVGLLSGKITVSWSAVAHADRYTVYVSNTGSPGTFTVAASNVASSPWTSPVLGLATYWFEVSAGIGSNWAGPNSAAAGPLLIVAGLACT
jgi:hypothetical protein